VYIDHVKYKEFQLNSSLIDLQTNKVIHAGLVVTGTLRRTCIQIVLFMITNIKCRSGQADTTDKRKEYSPRENRERED